MIVAIVSVFYFFTTRKHWNTENDVTYKASFAERIGFGVGTLAVVILLMLAVVALWFILSLVLR